MVLLTEAATTLEAAVTCGLRAGGERGEGTLGGGAGRPVTLSVAAFFLAAGADGAGEQE